MRRGKVAYGARCSHFHSAGDEIPGQHLNGVPGECELDIQAKLGRTPQCRRSDPGIGGRNSAYVARGAIG